MPEVNDVLSAVLRDDEADVLADVRKQNYGVATTYLLPILDRLAARVAAAERVVQAAREVADDEAKCRYDHNDFCQAHYSSRPCREEVLRDALAAWEAGK